MSMYVDDALCVVSTEAAWAELITEIEKRYDLSSKGNATLHLGLTVDHDRDNGTLTLWGYYPM
jgi:hypothetical protein